MFYLRGLAILLKWQGSNLVSWYIQGLINLCVMGYCYKWYVTMLVVSVSNGRNIDCVQVDLIYCWIVYQMYFIISGWWCWVGKKQVVKFMDTVRTISI